jgi:hypothetical protein
MDFIGAVVEIGVLSTLKRLLMESKWNNALSCRWLASNVRGSSPVTTPVIFSNRIFEKNMIFASFSCAPVGPLCWIRLEEGS